LLGRRRIDQTNGAGVTRDEHVCGLTVTVDRANGLIIQGEGFKQAASNERSIGGERMRR
jgi:hypothetical protein